MDGERRPVAAKAASVSPSGIVRGAARDAGQHHALRHFRHGQLAVKRGGGGGEGRHAGRQRVGNAEPVQPAKLLGERAVDGKIARVQPRHVVARAHAPPRTRPRSRRASAARCRRCARRRGNRPGAPSARSSPHRGRPGSARSGRVRARVMRSGAPGPAPMKCTVMAASSVLASAQVTGPTAMRGANQLRLRSAGGERRSLGD